MKNPDLPPAFEALYRRALNANPLARPKSAGEFANEFSAILAKSPGGSSRRLPAGAGPGQLGAGARRLAAPRSRRRRSPRISSHRQCLAAGGRRLRRRKSRPVDATQPMDAEMLAADHGRVLRRREGRDARQASEPTGSRGDRRPGQAPGASPPSASYPRHRRPAHGSRAQAATPAPRRPRAPRSPLLAPRSAWRSGPCRRLAGAADPRGAGDWLGRGLPAAQAPAARSQQGEGSATAGARGRPPEPRGTRLTPSEPQGDDPMAPAGRCLSGMKLVSGGAFKRGVAPGRQGQDARRAPAGERAGGLVLHRRVRVPQPAGRGAQRQRELGRGEAGLRERGQAAVHGGGVGEGMQGPRQCALPLRERLRREPLQHRRRTERRGSGAGRRSGSFLQCRSAYEVADLSGNVAEWTASDFGRQPPSKTQKGGAYDRPGYAVRCSARMRGVPTERRPTVEQTNLNE